MLVVLAISVTRDLLVTEWRKIYAGRTGGGPAGLFAFRRRSNTVAGREGAPKGARTCNYGATVNY